MKPLLKRLIKISDKTKIQIAKEIGISKDAVHRWLNESKEISKTNQEHIKILARRYGAK